VLGGRGVVTLTNAFAAVPLSHPTVADNKFLGLPIRFLASMLYARDR
jgi:hypothetical protein